MILNRFCKNIIEHRLVQESVQLGFGVLRKVHGRSGTLVQKMHRCNQRRTYCHRRGRRASIRTLFGPVSRCVRLCRENREQTPARAVRSDLGRFPRADGGRKLRQDKEQASSVTPCLVTSARSAGSCGVFRGVPKWGQNRRGDMASAVVFPDSLLPQEKSRSHAQEKMLSWAKKLSSALPNARAEDAFL